VQCCALGAFELLDQGETPGPIIINDYVNVAKAFYTEGEHSKVNAVLDKVATALDRK
jgi:N utilization substance protein B